jgi:hypothetical protein
VRLALPLAFEPRRIGVVWSRSSIRIRLLEEFIEEVRISEGVAPVK